MKRYLFFDTETTGLPLYFHIPHRFVNNWPRLVQLSWIVTDENGNHLKTADHIIRPSGFSIPQGASLIHGITTDMAMQKGEDLTRVVEEFLNDYENADLIVGHNIDFDKNVVGAEIIRIGLKDIIDTKPSVCTMKSSTDYCALYTEYGNKWPTLQELYKELFDESFNDAHNSASDVAATERCFWELRHLKIIPWHTTTSGVDLPIVHTFASEREKEIMLNRNFKRVNEEVERMVNELLGKG